MPLNYPACDWCGECKCCPAHDCKRCNMEPKFYEPIPCSSHKTHREHNWTHPEFGEVECLGIRLTPKEVPPNQIRNILDLMVKYGIIRITYDPHMSESSVEYWQRTLDGPIKDDVLLTCEEKEYYASEYDKCFGTIDASKTSSSTE